LVTTHSCLSGSSPTPDKHMLTLAAQSRLLNSLEPSLVKAHHLNLAEPPDPLEAVRRQAVRLTAKRIRKASKVSRERTPRNRLNRRSSSSSSSSSNNNNNSSSNSNSNDNSSRLSHDQMRSNRIISNKNSAPNPHKSSSRNKRSQSTHNSHSNPNPKSLRLLLLLELMPNKASHPHRHRPTPLANLQRQVRAPFRELFLKPVARLS
jgi:hypothetical protein